MNEGSQASHKPMVERNSATPDRSASGIEGLPDRVHMASHRTHSKYDRRGSGPDKYGASDDFASTVVKAWTLISTHQHGTSSRRHVNG